MIVKKHYHSLSSGYMINPYTPGNGIEPGYLAGRKEQIDEFINSLKSSEEGLPQNIVLYGLRGTGKTVLLRHYQLLAETNNWLVIDREFNERYCIESEFAQIFGKDIVTIASQASIKKKITETGKRIIEVLKPAEFSVKDVTYKPFYGVQNEVLEDYLKDLLISNWPVFQKANKKGVIFLYDEFHLVKDNKTENQYVLSSLMSAIAKAQREGCRYYLCICGLPLLKTNLKEAKTYTERMFIFQEIENLDAKEAMKALIEPLKKTNYSYENKLADQIVQETKGYPYFIQFYGYFLIAGLHKQNYVLSDLATIRPKLLKKLDKSFFEDRFKLASEQEKKILILMAHCNGHQVSANELAKKVKLNYRALQQLLFKLIEKGLIYRSRRGFYAFSIPLFKEYLLRQ